MVLINYCKINLSLELDNYQKFLTPHLKNKINKKHKIKDRFHSTIGYLLVLNGLVETGLYSVDCLENIGYEAYGRPYIKGNFDFNISHSGEIVGCAIAKGLRVGFDVENHKSVNLDDFRNVFNTEEFEFLKCENHKNLFFQYWTGKESVIKGDGIGLNDNLEDLDVRSQKIIFNDQAWYLHSFTVNELKSCYSFCLAINTKVENIKIKKIELSDLYCRLNFYKNLLK